MSQVERSDMTALHMRNASICYAHTQVQGLSSITEICNATELSRPTVTAALKTLKKLRLVECIDDDPTESERFGRPARLFGPHPQSPIAIAITEEVDARRIIIGRVNGSIIHRAMYPRTADMNDVESILSSISSSLIEHELSARSVCAVTVGISGTVDDSGNVLRSVWFPYLEGNTLINALKARFPVAAIENDVNLGARAEAVWGPARDSETVLYVLIGDRINTGLCFRGEILRGAFFNAGEVADFMNESLISTEMADAMNGADHSQLTNVQSAVTMAAIVCRVIDPDAIVLAGDYLSYYPDLVQSFTDTLHTSSNPQSRPLITTSTFGAETSVIGAFATALELGLKHIFQQDLSFIPLPILNSSR